MNELEFVTKHRRHLHQHPELSLHEFETTAYIKAVLDSLNIKYDCPLETGVIAYLEGNGSHTIAYRADIDALPILEENDVPYRSQSDHVMHACGHDGHTTALMLLYNVAKTCKMRVNYRKMSFSFSNLQKKLGGGANRLIKAGAFDKYPIEAVLVFMLTHLLMKALQ